MITLLWIYLALLCLVSSYFAGFQIDAQYRHTQNKTHRRIDIPLPLRKFFRFKWEAGPNVYLCAFAIETAGLVSFALILSCELLSLIFPKMRELLGLRLSFLVGYGVILLGVSSLCCIRDYLARSITKTAGKRCLVLEVIAHHTLERPIRMVYIVSVEESSPPIYIIEYGKWFKRQYKASVVNKKYNPPPGSYSKSIYTSQPPFFILIPSCSDIA